MYPKHTSITYKFAIGSSLQSRGRYALLATTTEPPYATPPLKRYRLPSEASGVLSQVSLFMIRPDGIHLTARCTAPHVGRRGHRYSYSVPSQSLRRNPHYVGPGCSAAEPSYAARKLATPRGN
ncbi:hypothetical protein BDZ91DRAFT_166849 [Kalaharituber pfeilii]|nr:hypothetical protein BDZ91DRAFT_166849 [Kalaharituber pfeilii]